ncbi:MAG: SdpI family protein, partial [Clostridiales bacterium]|nr:SdpI family protein [Clostridiales bacterium]
FIGHILPRVKSNFFMGVRTPWTLSDPDVWDRTQRLGGKLFFWAGIVLVPCALVLPEKVTFALLMAGVVVISALPAALSFWWYRKKENEER